MLAFVRYQGIFLQIFGTNRWYISDSGKTLVAINYILLTEEAPTEAPMEEWSPFIPEEPSPIFYGSHSIDEGKVWLSMVKSVIKYLIVKNVHRLHVIIRQKQIMFLRHCFSEYDPGVWLLKFL